MPQARDSKDLATSWPGWLRMESQRVRHNWSNLARTHALSQLICMWLQILCSRASPENTSWLKGAAAAAAKSLQSCPTLCDPIDGSPQALPGILQARTLEWVAISFSNAWKWKVKVKSLSWVRLLVTAWTAAYQAPLSMGFSRQEYWSGVPLPSPVEGSWQFPIVFTDLIPGSEAYLLHILMETSVYTHVHMYGYVCSVSHVLESCWRNVQQGHGRSWRSHCKLGKTFRSALKKKLLFIDLFWLCLVFVATWAFL